MKILRDTLLKALEATKLAVAKKGEVEQLSHFIFTGEEIVTFNNKMAIFLKFPTPFECSVRADIFHKQISKFKSEGISINLKGSRLEIRGNKEKATMAVSTNKDEEVFKILHTLQNDHVDCEYYPLPANFGIGASFTSFSTSKSTGDGVLQCIYVIDDCIYSSDHFRATQFTMDGTLEHQFLIHRETAVKLNEYVLREYSIGDNWYSFYCENDTVICTRKIFGKYPQFQNAFDFDKWEVIEFPEDMDDALDFVSVVVSKQDILNKICDVSVKNNLVTVSTQNNTEVSEKSFELENGIDGEIQFFINLEWMKTILKHTRKLNYDLETQRAMFANGHFKHMIRMAIL